MTDNDYKIQKILADYARASFTPEEQQFLVNRLSINEIEKKIKPLTENKPKISLNDLKLFNDALAQLMSIEDMLKEKITTYASIEGNGDYLNILVAVFEAQRRLYIFSEYLGMWSNLEQDDDAKMDDQKITEILEFSSKIEHEKRKYYIELEKLLLANRKSHYSKNQE